MIRKIAILLLSLALFLSIAPLADIQAASLDPCVRDAGSDLHTLCDLSTGSVSKAIQSGITILFIVAVIAALFFLIFGGIKWITSGGDKAQLEIARNTIIASIIGLILVFSSFFILNIALNFFGLPSASDFKIPKLGSAGGGGGGGGTCSNTNRSGSCPSGKFCARKDPSVYQCVECNASNGTRTSQCPTGKKVCNNFKCVKCTNNGHCSPSTFCRSNSCVPRSI